LPVIRDEHKNNFTQISNSLLNDENISYGARGLLASALTNCEGWNFRGEEYFTTANDKKAKVKSYLKELIKHGYLIRYQEKNDKGNFGKMIYIFKESPKLDKASAGLMLTENQIAEEGEEKPSVQTIVDLPITGKPITRNQMLNNTNINNINNININKKEKVTAIDNIINSYSTNENIKTAIKDFLKMRKSINKPITEKALIGILNELNKLSRNDDEKIEILNQSIIKCWKDVYPLKNKSQKGGRNYGEHRNFLEQSSNPIYTRCKF
jgi:hypothetical protein